MQRFRSATLWYTVVGFVGPAVALLLTPLYTRALGIAGYGTVDVVQSFWQGIFTVAFWGMGTVFAGLYTRSTDPARQQTVMASVLLVTAVLAAVVGVAVALWRVSIATLLARPDVAPVLPLLAAALPFAVVNATFQALFRLRLDIGRSVAATLGLVVISAGTRLGLVVWADAGVTGMLWALALTNVAMALWCTVLGWRLVRCAVDWTLVREILWAGAPLLPVSIAGWVVLYADRWLLASQVTAEALGQYALAVLVASLAAFLFEPLKSAWLPVALRLRDSAFVAVSLRAAAGVIAVVVTGLVAAAPTALWLIGGGAAVAAAPLVLPLVVLPVASLWQTIVGVTAVRTVRTGVFGVSGVVAAGVNVGLNLLLIPRWGVMGAAWATSAAALAATAVVCLRERQLVASVVWTRDTAVWLGWSVLLGSWWWTGWWELGVACSGAAALSAWRTWQLWPVWRSAVEPQRDDAGVTGEIG